MRKLLTTLVILGALIVGVVTLFVYLVQTGLLSEESVLGIGITFGAVVLGVAISWVVRMVLGVASSSDKPRLEDREQ